MREARIVPTALRGGYVMRDQSGASLTARRRWTKRREWRILGADGARIGTARRRAWRGHRELELLIGQSCYVVRRSRGRRGDFTLTGGARTLRIERQLSARRWTVLRDGETVGAIRLIHRWGRPMYKMAAPSASLQRLLFGVVVAIDTST